jgi:hypothetical protein
MDLTVADPGGSGLIIGLSVAIGVFGFLLLLSVVAYCMLPRHLGRHRQNSDHQELSLQGPMIEVVSCHKRLHSSPTSLQCVVLTIILVCRNQMAIFIMVLYLKKRTEE